ncbi:MAG: histone deacetylase family protein [Anaerolineae bacterium]
MHTFYYQGHQQHDPARLHDSGRPEDHVYYSEVAQRGEIIHEALKTAALGPITEPGDFGMVPIGEVHEYGMINLLQNAFNRLSQRSKKSWLLPNTFRLSYGSKHKPLSLWGLLGYYCFDTSSPIFEHTWDAAYWSAQTALSAAALVAAGGEPMAYALCRPPGHHAATDMFGGFCYLNNAAIAANWLVQQGHRVAILDLDYHHGNGTQSIFYGRSDVLFCSVHADPLREYPYYWGYADEFGAGVGKGFNFNFPLPLGVGEAEYFEAVRSALDTIRLYVPDTLVLSLGVDTRDGDPLGRFSLTTDSFARLGRQIGENGWPIVVIQEGGYQLDTLGKDIVAFLSALAESHPRA